jgi:aminoglycoside phosphotransferase (APT) family kinase protein
MRVLRRYRDGCDATPEAEVMRHVARYGYPVPYVYSAAGPDLVMERLDGPTMWAAVQEGDLAVDHAATILVSLADRLHRIPGRSCAAEGARVLHLDLHPLNVMLVPSGPVVIDWRNARDGDPHLDVAMSALILAQVAVSGAEGCQEARAMLTVFVPSAGYDPRHRLVQALHMRRRDANLTADELECLTAAAALVRASA